MTFFKPKLDSRKYAHVFGELYNQPVAIHNESVIEDLESNIINARLGGGKDYYDNIPMPYTVAGAGIIPIKGVLLSSCSPEEMACGACSCEQIKAWIDEALADPGVQGVIFNVDSPGGSIGGINSLADYISEKKAVKTMACFVDGDCCSAALWLMASLPIYVTPMSQVGSVGVTFTIKDTSKLYADQGVKVIQFKSSEFKGQGADGVPVTDEYIKQLQAKAVKIGSRFAEFVIRNRQLKDVEQALNGLAYLDEEAIELGLADGMVKRLEDLFS